jgi:DNA modification methylase
VAKRLVPLVKTAVVYQAALERPAPAAPPAVKGPNRLFYGDNLDVLRQHIDTESVDLIYLDPPFNSNRSYNVLFKSHTGAASQAQIEAFDDSWHWSQQAEKQYQALVSGGAPIAVSDAIEAMRTMLGTNDVLAYLVMMTARLVELHRVLKPTGSLYLHCDPTASHYLKIVLDAIFGPTNFRNEITWQRTLAKSLMTRRLPSNHDVLLAYQKTESAIWNDEAIFLPYVEGALDAKTASKYRFRDSDDRLYRLDSLINPNPDRPNLTYEFLGVTRVWRWTSDRMQNAYDQGIVVQSKPGRVPQLKRYIDEQRGRPLGDVWTDIPPINSRAGERLGYPTQKPLALLERIIAMSSNPGDVVLDPFCGCGTAVDAAQKLHRRWIGIDITYLAIDLITKRMRHTYGDEITKSYRVRGIPTDAEGAEALFAANPFDFERWAVSLVDGQPNERQVGDKGIDGRIRFHDDAKRIGWSVVSVKGGRQVNPTMIRDLVGTVQQQRADMGLLILMAEPTPGIREVADKSGSYVNAMSGTTYPKVQVLTVAQLLAGQRPKMPAPILPYVQAKARYHQPGLF